MHRMDQTADDRQRYFLLHIPKTAGTSFRVMLWSLFPPDAILPTQADLDANGGRYLRLAQLEQLPAERLQACRLLCGHLPSVAAEILPERPETLVFLREPVARAVSNLRHIQRRDRRGRPLIDLLDDGGIRTRIVDNRQTQMLSFRSLDEAREHATITPDRDRLELAKRRLEECSFVGLTERFSDSLALCRATYGWDLPSEEPRRNVAPKLDDRAEREVAEVEPQLREALALDLELYESGVSLFADRMTRAGAAG